MTETLGQESHDLLEIINPYLSTPHHAKRLVGQPFPDDLDFSIAFAHQLRVSGHDSCDRQRFAVPKRSQVPEHEAEPRPDAAACADRRTL
jgi:hypothetical protein